MLCFLSFFQIKSCDGIHCFVLRTTSDGKQLVYDTSVGIIYPKDLYYDIEKPEIKKINSKGDIKTYVEKVLKCSKIYNTSDYSFTFDILGIIQEKVQNSKNEIYRNQIIQEIEKFRRRLKEKGVEHLHSL